MLRKRQGHTYVHRCAATVGAERGSRAPNDPSAIVFARDDTVAHFVCHVLDVVLVNLCHELFDAAAGCVSRQCTFCFSGDSRGAQARQRGGSPAVDVLLDHLVDIDLQAVEQRLADLAGLRTGEWSGTKVLLRVGTADRFVGPDGSPSREWAPGRHLAGYYHYRGPFSGHPSPRSVDQRRY